MAHGFRWFLSTQVVMTAAVGLAAIGTAGGPRSALIVQSCALAFGLAAAWGASGLPAPGGRSAAGVLALALAAVAATLLVGPGLEGVHRWLAAGPVLLHTMAVILPFVVWAYGSAPSGWLPTAGIVGLVLLMALQPDGASLLGLSFALIGRLLATRPINLPTALAAVTAAAATVWIWTQPDPLPAVPHVERVVVTAWKAVPALGAAAGVLLLALPLSILVAGRGRPSPLVWSLVGLWAGLVLANLVGNYPAPVIGYSASLAIGWLASLGLAVGAPGPSATKA